MNTVRRIGTGHTVATLCFTLLAGLRAADQSWVWMTVFVLAAASQLYLGLRRARTPSQRLGVDRETPIRRGEHRHRVKTWRWLTVSSSVLTIVLLAVQPVLSVLAAIVSIYCLWMMIRLRNLSTTPNATETPAGSATGATSLEVEKGT